jgi:pyruvate dehydrogenase E2 component (dihydrolipoamide acetyltransferase)
MARELGINIDQVGGSGPHGRISIDDVKAQAKRLVAGGAGGNGTAFAGEPLPDFTRWGDVERQPMKAVRRKTAQHLIVAWSTIPHVTQHDLADITGLEELRKRYAPKAEAAGGSLTITAIAAKVVATALKLFPQFNVSIDLAADELIYKKYVNIGIAVDTDRGLLVPVIRDVDTKNIVQISAELVQLSEKARARKISLDEMQGGCFSISNLGGIGGTSFTPIVNAPEVAILGISRARMEPVYDNAGGFAPRLMLPLSLSYDHRAIDGADGARFLRWIVEALEQPFLLAFQG